MNAATGEWPRSINKIIWTGRSDEDQRAPGAARADGNMESRPADQQMNYAAWLFRKSICYRDR